MKTAENMDTPPSPVAQKSFAAFAATESTDLPKSAPELGFFDSLITRILKVISWKRDAKPLPKDLTLPEYNPVHPTKENTVLYLAYGSNLCAATFRGSRKINPLSAANVLVPSLELCFDLPGVPYMEPRFASTIFTEESAMPSELKMKATANEKDALLHSSSKNTAPALGWKKGLVGVVYEVTKEDFAHIIATEGGGSSYADVEVDCYQISRGTKEVPTKPIGQSFRAHTLFGLGADDRQRNTTAQASIRYLGLLRTGSVEHNLPEDYKKWLHGLQGYTITSTRQSIGKVIFLLTWLPFMLVVMSTGRLFVDKKGRAPKWYGWIQGKTFGLIWFTYDWMFKGIWGNGERTV